MTKSARSTKFLLIALMSSLTVSSFVTADGLNLQLVPQKSSRLKKTASIIGDLFGTVAAGVGFFAIVDAFMNKNKTKNSKLLQGGIGATTLFASLYMLGFFEAGSGSGNGSYDGYHHECGCGCHDSYDSYHTCSCYDGSCCNHAFCHDHYEQEEDTYGQESDNAVQVINTVTVETVSNDVMCNETLTNFWEDPFNY